MKKFYLILFALCLSRTFGYAQGFSILNNSNYSPVNSVYFNPAKIADSKQKFQINLFSGNLYLANDYGVLKSIPQFIKTIQNSGEFGELLTFRENGKNKNMDFGAEIRGPSFVASIGQNQSMAFTTRARVLFNANNVSEQLMKLLVEGLKDNPMFGDVNNASFDVNANVFSEMGLSYSRVLLNTGKHVVKGGVTGKYMIGADNAQMYTNGTTNISIEDKVLYTTISTSGINVNMNVANGDLITNAGNKISLKSILNNSGQGFGTDFGFEYEFRPHYQDYKYEIDGKIETDNSVPKYAIKFGFALTDMGSITYSKGKQIFLRNLDVDHEWTEAQANNFDQADLEGSLKEIYPAVGDVTSTLKYRAQLPSRLNMNLDFKVAKNFYVATNYMGKLTKKAHEPDPTGTLINLIPRIEKSNYEVALPITYSSRYKKVNVGLASRGGAFFMGTDDIGGALGIGKFTSLNLYAGLNISLGKKRKKDRDKDTISDKLDKCPNIAGPVDNQGCPWPDTDKDGVPDKDDGCISLPGPVATHGCPDSDGDGIADDGDNCPSIPGPLSAQGCPDNDGDGIADKDDLCPTQPGSRDAKGCPDRDHDGIADKDDKCPDTPGTAALMGCPDKDNDGIADSEDLCPEIPGSIAMKGCPDRDNDGVADKDDACPDLAGPIAAKGCPDTDGDGILDKDDLCPTAAGPLAFKGCPDTDKDGVADSEDACPTVPGPLALKGCPDRDKDGIADNEDLCPDVFGTLASKGCPDKDGDGVADKDDKCIDVVGPASNGGCPVTEKAILTTLEQKIIIAAVADLQFETGKSVIKAYSFDSLDELAALMVKRPELTLILSGHTDNVGKPASNKQLSMRRAQAVKSYLMDGGVDGSRIAAVGYGSAKPIASNKTPQGRQKNRRVEFKVN